MIPFGQYVRGLARDDKLRTVPETADDPVDIIAGEALRASGPALRFERESGVDLASGVFSGPNLMRRRESKPWTRLSLGLGFDSDAEFVDLLETIAHLGPAGSAAGSTYTSQSASPSDADIQDLQFPQETDGMWPSVTLGLAAVGTGEGSHWAPAHGSVVSTDTLRVRLPESVTELIDDNATITIALGVPPAAITAATALAVTGQLDAPVRSCGVSEDVPAVPTNGGSVPAASEVVIETTVQDRTPEDRTARREAWEFVTSSTALSLSVERVLTTDNPVVPFTPLGYPMADDTQLTGLAVAASLYHRVNNYWAISPVEWIMLPAEAELGICVVSSDILYPGFEWQLANILFSFSSLFDTVVIVDDDVPPTDFGRVLSDIWVKANPAQDWVFGDSNAPAARRPHYRQDGTTGSRLYVNAAWDPRWESTYIAPRVTFEESFPRSIRDTARAVWNENR